MFRTFGKRESLIVDALGLAVTVAAVATLAFVFIGSSLNRHNSLEDQRQQLQAKTAYVDQLETVLNIGTATQQTLAEYVAAADYDFPAELDFPEFFNPLAGNARLTDVRLMQVEPGSVSVTDKYTAMNIAIMANSSFSDFCSFLYELENMPRLVKLESLKLTPEEDGDMCNIHFVVSIFAKPGAGEVYGD